MIQRRPITTDVATASSASSVSEPQTGNGSAPPTFAQVQAEIAARLAADPELTLAEKFSLFERKLKAALADSSVTASELERIARETDVAIEVARQEALAAHERGLDFVASPDAKAAREAIENAEFAISRLLTQRPRLEALLDARQQAEQRAAYLVRYEQLKIEGAALGAELADSYGAVMPLLDLFGRLRAFRERCRALHLTDPGDGRPHLPDPELKARRLDGFSAEVKSLLEAVRLPDFTSGRELWPEKPPSFAASFSASMVPQHPGAAWCSPEYLEARHAERRRKWPVITRRKRPNRNREKTKPFVKIGTPRKGEQRRSGLRANKNSAPLLDERGGAER